MASTDGIATWSVEMYKNNVFTATQQMGSKQLNTVTISDVVGRSKYVEGIGTTEPEPLTTRHAISPIIEVPHLRRQLVIADYHWGTMIDTVDKIRLLVDPTSKYATAAVYAWGRLYDKLINANLVGAARGGMTGADIIPLSDSQKIGFTSNEPMSLDLLLAISKRFKQNEADQGPIYFAISPTQETELLREQKITSIDYQTGKALTSGNVPDVVVGFRFIVTNLLELDENNKRHCIAYVKPSLEFGFGERPKVRMAENPERSFNMYLYMQMSAGAVRTQETQVIEFAAYEDPAVSHMMDQKFSAPLPFARDQLNNPSAALPGGGNVKLPPQKLYSEKETIDRIQFEIDKHVGTLAKTFDMKIKDAIASISNTPTKPTKETK